MATKKTYNIGGVKVRATSESAAKKLAKEISGESSSSSSKKETTPQKNNVSTPQKQSSVSIPTVNYQYNYPNETSEQYTARVKKEIAARDSAIETAKEQGAQPTYESPEVDDAFEKNELEAELSKSGLPDSQKNAIRALYESIATNDRKKMQGYAAALKAGLDIADPVFKAQSRVLLDELDRAITGKENDKAYKEQQLTRTLDDLRADITSSGEYLSLEEQNDMRSLERQLGTELTGLQDELAMTGLTSSSIASRKRELRIESYGDLRESKKRSYAQKTESLTNQRVRGERDYQSEVERLQELLKADKLNLIGSVEKDVGSNAIREAGLSPVLGELPGSLEQKKYDYADQFARSFVF